LITIPRKRQERKQKQKRNKEQGKKEERKNRICFNAKNMKLFISQKGYLKRILGNFLELLA